MRSPGRLATAHLHRGAPWVPSVVILAAGRKPATRLPVKSLPRLGHLKRRLTERFSNALSIIATAARALNLAQAEVQPVPGHDIGEDIITLGHGIEALRALYNELDVAIREVRA